MLSKSEHIKQIKRFHDRVEKVKNEIKYAEEDKRGKKSIALHREFFRLMELWEQIDSFVELKIKDFIDIQQVE